MDAKDRHAGRRIGIACALIALLGFVAACVPQAPREPTSSEPSAGDTTSAEPPAEPPHEIPKDSPPPGGWPKAKPPSGGASADPRRTADRRAPATAADAAPKPKYQVVNVLYATDRARDAGTRVDFGGNRGEAIQYGTCVVSIPSTHQTGSIERPSWRHFEFRENPEKHVVLLDVSSATHDAFVTTLAARVADAPGRTALVFVHGYNVTFADAARRTAQIAYDIRFAGVPIFFSWPSVGAPLAYPIDMTNADWAQEDLKAFLLDLADHSGADNIVLIAHSMGNRVLASALIDAAQARPGFAARVREVVLAAPDIDADMFRRSLAPRLIAAARGATLYASSTDAALEVSHRYNGEPRAGDVAAGPIVVTGMETIDASAVDPGPLGHSYIGESPSVLDDVAKLVDQGARAGTRLGDPVSGPLGAYWRMAAAVTPAGGTH